MKKQILVSGITPTGDLTIGNYIGAIKNFVALQNEYEMFIFVADLHAITTEIEPAKLHQNIRNIMALYIACGLDTNKVHLFVQSDILEHANLGHILLTKTTIGELNRMHQFKSKSQVHANGTEFVPTGILTYPTLMSADILLYNPDIVPVGQDQKQHIELTRNIAIRFNNQYGKTFNVPEPYIAEIGSKIMNLTNPAEKMSKSSKAEKSFIKLLEDPNQAYKKIMGAVTDSENKVYFDAKTKAGISNLMTIYAGLKDVSVQEVSALVQDMNYKEFKELVAQTIKTFLTNLQAKYQVALTQVEEIRKKGAQAVRPLAHQTLTLVKEKMGF